MCCSAAYAYTLHAMCCSAACGIPICCMRCAVPLHACTLHAMCCSAACSLAACDVPLHAYMLHMMCCPTACFLAACVVPQLLFHHLPLHPNQSIRSAGWSTRPTTWQSLDPLPDANTLADTNCPATRAPPPTQAEDSRWHHQSHLPPVATNSFRGQTDRRSRKDQAKPFQSGADPRGGVCAAHPGRHDRVYNKCDGHKL